MTDLFLEEQRIEDENGFNTTEPEKKAVEYPWWMKIDGKGVLDVEEAMDQFYLSKHQRNLELTCLKSTYLKSKHVEVLETKYSQEAKEAMLRWSSNVQDYMLTRQVVTDRYQRKALLGDFVKARQQEMQGEESSAEGSGSEEEPEIPKKRGKGKEDMGAGQEPENRKAPPRKLGGKSRNSNNLADVPKQPLPGRQLHKRGSAIFPVAEGIVPSQASPSRQLKLSSGFDSEPTTPASHRPTNDSGSQKSAPLEESSATAQHPKSRGRKATFKIVAPAELNSSDAFG